MDQIGKGLLFKTQPLVFFIVISARLLIVVVVEWPEIIKILLLFSYPRL